MSGTNFQNGIIGPLTGAVTGNVAGGISYPVTVASVDGAITIAPGLIAITKAGVCALTLANPAVADNGMIISIVSTTAQAHTIANTSGLNDLGAAGDLATFAGAKGNGLTLIAYAQRWYILASAGITLS